MQRDSNIIVSSALLTCMGMLAIYWIGLHGDFFFDDWTSIVLVNEVQLHSLSAESIRMALKGGDAGPLGRPVAQLSFALNYYFSGFSPFAFKATNLAIHLSCGALVFCLARKILGGGNLSFQPSHHVTAASAAVSVVWLAHPIQLLPVLHVVQRMTSLSAFFLFAALSLHIYGRNRGGRIGVVAMALAWIAVWPLSVFSKETGLLFPAFVLAWECIIRRSAVGRLDTFARVFSITAGALLAGIFAYSFSAYAQWAWSGYDFRSFSLMERLLTEGRVLGVYLGLIFVPRLSGYGLHHDDIAISSSLFRPWTTSLALLGLVGLLWLAWRMRKHSPLVAFGIVWFFLGHALESTALPLEIAHEHRNYVPLFGILIAVGSMLLRLFDGSRILKATGLATTSAVVVLLAFTTAMRSHQFGNELRRVQVEVEYHPGSARAHYDAGVAMAGVADARVPHSPVQVAAGSHYKRATEIDTSFKAGLLGLIALNCQSGLSIPHGVVQELSRRLRETPFAPGDQTVLYNLKEMSVTGKTCLSRAQVDALFTAALTNPSVSNGVRAILHSWHADYLWLSEHDLTAAREALGESLKMNPSNPSNRLKWAQLLLISGDREGAHTLLLALRTQNFSTEESATLTELLAAVNIPKP